MSYRPEEIHALQERLERALSLAHLGLIPLERADDLTSELDAAAAALSPVERETVGRYLEDMLKRS